MGESKLSTAVRKVLAKIRDHRQERAKQVRSQARFILRTTGKSSRSTRGEPGNTWNTKKWTKARKIMRNEHLDKVIARDKAARAASRATHVERHA